MSEDINSFIKINELFDLYGALLSPSQKEIMDLYYHFNLSLSEIAEEKGISRSAVNDAIKKATLALNEYEDKLKIAQNKAKLQHFLKKISKLNEVEEIKKEIERYQEGL